VKTPSPAATTPLPPAVLAGSVPGVTARPRKSEERLDDVEPPRPARSGRPLLIATAVVVVAAIVAVVWALMPDERRSSRTVARPAEPAVIAEPPPPAEPIVAPPPPRGVAVMPPAPEPPPPAPELRPPVKALEHHRSRSRSPGNSGAPAKPPRARDPSIAPVID